MKVQLTPEQKRYRDLRDMKIIQIISPFGLLFLGTWMLISPAKPRHASVEKATTSVLKDLWGFETGIVLLVLAAIWLFFSIRAFIRFKKSTPKPL